MGLFDRALALSDQHPGTVDKERHPHGLLARSAELLSEPKTRAIGHPSLSSVEHEPAVGTDVAAVAAGVAGLEGGLESPAVLFDYFTDKLDLSKAALLVWDQRRAILSPWAATGFDPTTLRRLRMKPNMCTAVSVLSTPEELEPYRRFFSVREFSTLSRLLLVPITVDEDPPALLLVADCGDPQRMQLLADNLSVLASADYTPLFSVRSMILSRDPRRSPFFAKGVTEGVDELIRTSSSESHRFVVVEAGLESYVQCVYVRYPVTDRFRLAQDLAHAAACLVGPAGCVCALPTERLLLVVYGTTDWELFCHQLDSRLRPLLPTCHRTEEVALSARARRFPDDGDSAEELIGTHAGEIQIIER